MNQSNQTNPLNPPISPNQQVEKDRVLKVLVREIERLKKEIDDIRNGKIIDSLQIPEEQPKKPDFKKTSHRLYTEKGWRPLSEAEIDEAQKATDNSTDAAKYLGITYRTYKKWCVTYNKWKINAWGKGSKKKYWDPNRGKYPLNQIMDGKYPKYPIFRLKDLLIRSKIKEAKCEVCGFDERRVTDDKLPLLVNFIDGNEKNRKKENLQILCYNHYFLMGRGYIRRGKIEFNFLDPDRI